MATVYEGLDQGFSPPRRVAVKLMNSQISEDPEFRARFEHEASLVADFRHDNIVRVYASGETQGTKYIVMEYLPGGTLSARLDGGSPLLPEEVVHTGAQLADALAYAHGRGVVHRDFKPGNVLFTSENKPVLSDFGVAKSVKTADAQLTRHASVIGAPRYMAPEQERGDPVCDRADIYSLGLTLHEMLTGRLPSSRERVLQTPEAGVEIREKLAPLAPSLAELICRCLLADSGQRPSAADCAQELRSESALTMARPGARMGGAATQRSRGAIIGAVSVFAVVVLAGVGIYTLRPRSESVAVKQVEAATAATSKLTVPSTAAPTTVPKPTIPSTGRRESAPQQPSNLMQVPAPPGPLPVGAASAGEAAQTALKQIITLTCGTGDPHTLLNNAVTNGLSAKVQLTLAADQDAQREAARTLQHQIACLESLARTGVKSEDSARLQEDAKLLLENH
jgi:hypothetical protein